MKVNVNKYLYLAEGGSDIVNEIECRKQRRHEIRYKMALTEFCCFATEGFLNINSYDGKPYFSVIIPHAYSEDNEDIQAKFCFNCGDKIEVEIREPIAIPPTNEWIQEF